VLHQELDEEIGEVGVVHSPIAQKAVLKLQEEALDVLGGHVQPHIAKILQAVLAQLERLAQLFQLGIRQVVETLETGNDPRCRFLAMCASERVRECAGCAWVVIAVGNDRLYVPNEAREVST